MQKRRLNSKSIRGFDGKKSFKASLSHKPTVTTGGMTFRSVSLQKKVAAKGAGSIKVRGMGSLPSKFKNVENILLTLNTDEHADQMNEDNVFKHNLDSCPLFRKSQNEACKTM